MVAQPSVALSEEYHIDSWTTENGLPQNVIRDICQTPDGYLWLATLDGLVRFDGVRFVIFNRSNTPGILGNRFTSLYCTPNGEFWAGTEFSGVTRYNQGEFTTYTVRQGLPANYIPAVTGDDAGHIWALSQTAIVQWNGVGFQLTDLPSEASKCNYFPFAGNGFVCWASDSVHLFARGQLLRYPLPHFWPRQAAGRDWSGVIWVRSADCRFARLNGGRWTKMYTALKRETSSKWADQVSVYSDGRGNRWWMSVGCELGAGQALNVPSRGQLQRIVFNSLFEDREGSIWLGMDGQGLYRVRRQTVTTLSKENGLPDRNVYPIYQDRQGTIWVGTWDGGLARLNNREFIAVSIPAVSTPEGLTSKRIHSIFEDRDGVLWVATSAGLYKRQGVDFQPVHDSIPGGTQGVHAVHQDSQGTLWIGTDHGLLRFKGGIWRLLTTKDGLATDDLRVIIDGQSGNLWIGGYGGLTSFDHGEFKHWTEADGLPSDSIRSLYEDADGTLWIGTYDGGLGMFKDGRFTRITTRDGLFNNGVFQILEDARGYLWMSCNRGIYRVSKRELNEFALGKRTAISSTVYGKSEGMSNAECNGGLSPAGIRAHDGKLWFPTQDGVAVVDPDAVSTNPLPPPVVIESISLDHRPQHLDRPIRVSPGSENLEIDYTALSFLNSEHIRFRYKLQGLDRDWVEAHTRRTAYYSHLPPGSYVFNVIAANSDGVWNAQGQSLSIVVLPSFYRTWWFLTLALTATLGAAVLVWQSRVSEFKRRHAMQQAFTRQLIASQESERKRIAAELHDGLGQQLVVIKNLALISLSHETAQGDARPQMEEISAEATQALSEVKKISYNLRPYQLDRLGLTKAIEGIVKQASAATKIVFTSDIDAIDNVFAKDSEINFYRIVQECVNNLVKYSQATTANVTVQRAADDLQLTVSDNGRGFTPGAASSSSEASGFGLIGISERAELLGGRLAIHSEPDQGTTISVKIPVGGDGHGP